MEQISKRPLTDGLHVVGHILEHEFNWERVHPKCKKKEASGNLECSFDIFFG